MSEPCCPDDDGSAHHHCPYCGCSCSRAGHVIREGDNQRLECPDENDRPPWAVEHVTLEVPPMWDGSGVSEEDLN